MAASLSDLLGLEWEIRPSQYDILQRDTQPSQRIQSDEQTIECPCALPLVDFHTSWEYLSLFHQSMLSIGYNFTIIRALSGKERSFFNFIFPSHNIN